MDPFLITDMFFQLRALPLPAGWKRAERQRRAVQVVRSAWAPALSFALMLLGTYLPGHWGQAAQTVAGVAGFISTLRGALRQAGWPGRRER